MRSGLLFAPSDIQKCFSVKCQFMHLNHSFLFFPVTKLQTSLDRFLQHLLITQGHIEELRYKVKTVNNFRHKAAAEKTQAEEKKLKQVHTLKAPDVLKVLIVIDEVTDVSLKMLLCHQDLYVERLTKEMERLTQQIAMYDAQTSAQAEETGAAKEALSEVTVRGGAKRWPWPPLF